MRSSNPSASVFWKSEAEGAPSPKNHDVQPNWRVRCHFYEHSKGMLYRNQPFNIHTTILLMQADEWQLSSGSCRSLDARERRQCRRRCRSCPLNRNSVTSHRLSFPGAVILLRLPFNARRDSLRHCIPPGFSLVVPCVFQCCFHFSPRYGILPL